MTTVPSSPPTFSLTRGGSQVVTFSIPAGTYTSASFNITSSISGASGSYDNVMGFASDTVGSGLSSGNGAWNYSVTCSSAQLADINAAAGGTLAGYLDLNLGGASILQSITAFTLTLNGAVYIIPDPVWGIGYQVSSTPILGQGLSTPCGGFGVGGGGGVFNPGAVTLVWDLNSSVAVGSYTINMGYAGSSLLMAVDTSPDGTTWTTQYTTNIGSNHGGSYYNEAILYSFGAS